MTINAMEYREKDGGSKLAANPDPAREGFAIENFRSDKVRERILSVASSRILFKLE